MSATERRREPTGPGFVDAVTFAWADREAEVYGFARLGIADGAGSALGVLFRGREPSGVIALGSQEVPPGDDWDVAMSGIAMETVEPGERWRLEADLGGSRVALDFTAVGAAVGPGAGADLVRAGGMESSERACRVTGAAQVGGETISVDGVGQRGHAWGTPDWERIALARTVSAWTQGGDGVALSAVRPAKAKAHDGEAVWASLLGSGETVEDPRLSTTYDADGRHLRAGIELWVSEEDPYPRRGAGEALCGSTLDLGKLRLDCAFFSWRIDGQEAVGRYDVLRRA